MSLTRPRFCAKSCQRVYTSRPPAWCKKPVPGSLRTCSLSDRRQASLLIVADSAQTFKLHVTTLNLPLVVLLKQQSSNKANDGRIVGEDTDDAGATFDLGVEPFQGLGGDSGSAVRALRCVRLRIFVGVGVSRDRGDDGGRISEEVAVEGGELADHLDLKPGDVVLRCEVLGIGNGSLRPFHGRR